MDPHLSAFAHYFHTSIKTFLMPQQSRQSLRARPPSIPIRNHRHMLRNIFHKIHSTTHLYYLCYLGYFCYSLAMTTLAAVDLGEKFTLKDDQGISSFTNIRDFVSDILPNVFTVAGLILLGLIIVGGIGMIATAGNPEAQQKNKGLVTNAAIGFAIVLGSFWIIQIIQVITGVNILN